MNDLSGSNIFIHVSRCIFVDGVHVYSGPNCPHDDTEATDTDPPIGWTAQQNDRT